MAHHVTQRGNNRQDDFFLAADRRANRKGREGRAGLRFLARLETQLSRRLVPAAQADEGKGNEKSVLCPPNYEKSVLCPPNS